MPLLGDGFAGGVLSLDIRLIVDRIPAFTWSARPDGSVEFVNQVWREYAGLSLEESQGWGWQAAIHPHFIATSCYRRMPLRARDIFLAILEQVRRRYGALLRRWKWL